MCSRDCTVPEADGLQSLLRFFYIICKRAQSNRGSLRTRFLFSHAVCECPGHFWNFRNPATIIFTFCFNVKLQILAPNGAWRFSLGGHIK
jgi:hypothetical protein